MGVQSTPYKKCKLIWESLLRQFPEDLNPYKAPMSRYTIEVAIGEICGIDSRTINKYILWSIRFSFIKEIKGKFYLIPEGDRMK